MKHKTALFLGVLGILLPSMVLAEQQTQTRTFSVGAGGRLVADVGAGDLFIRLGEVAGITVTASGVEASDLELEQQGNLLSLRSSARGWNDIEFNIEAPAQLDLELRTGGGDISIEGTLEGLLQAKTAGGDIEFQDIRGELEVETSGGDIEGGEILGNAFVRTMGGDIELRFVDGDLEIETMGGDIEIGDVSASLRTRTMGGDVSVGNVGGSVEISSKGGDVTLGSVAQGLQVETAGGDIELEGAQGDVLIKTAGGDLDLRNVTGSIDAETAGGDVHVELSPSGQASSIVSMAGDIGLVLAGDAAATVEAIVIRAGGWEEEDEYRITADAALTLVTESRQGNSLRAVYELNGGGNRVTLKTTNGDIRIRRGQVLR